MKSMLQHNQKKQKQNKTNARSMYRLMTVRYYNRARAGYYPPLSHRCTIQS